MMFDLFFFYLILYLLLLVFCLYVCLPAFLGLFVGLLVCLSVCLMSISLSLYIYLPFSPSFSPLLSLSPLQLLNRLSVISFHPPPMNQHGFVNSFDFGGKVREKYSARELDAHDCKIDNISNMRWFIKISVCLII